MMSQTSFVELMHSLGDVDAPPVDGRSDSIHRKITRVRRRRTVVAVVAVIALLTAGFTAFGLRPGSETVPADRTMPTSWVADDGLTYVRVGLMTLNTATHKSVSIRVPASTPIAIRSTCDDKGLVPKEAQGGQLPTVSVHYGGADTTDQTIDCFWERTPVLSDYDVRTSADADGMVTITIRGSLAGFKNVVRVFPAKWTFGVYVWRAPTALRTPPVLHALPNVVHGYTLQASKTATWPAQKAVTFPVPAHTTWGLLVTCSGAFSGAAQDSTPDSMENTEEVTVHGEKSPAELPICQGMARVNASASPSHLGDTTGDTAAEVTITFRAFPMYDQRAGRLLIGLYTKK